MNAYSNLLKNLFFLSLFIMGIGFVLHIASKPYANIANIGALVLIISPTVSFAYLSVYYLKQKNKRLFILSFALLVILLLNIAIQW